MTETHFWVIKVFRRWDCGKNYHKSLISTSYKKKIFKFEEVLKFENLNNLTKEKFKNFEICVALID
jgi:hypothetical protein